MQIATANELLEQMVLSFTKKLHCAILWQREFVFSHISYSVSHQLKMTLQESEPKIESKFLGQKQTSYVTLRDT